MRGGSVVATNITKEYGATVVLDRVSLTVPPGARIGVVGPNGSGKSTLLRVLAGVDEPSAGRVERIGTVGYLPQEPERRGGETLLGFLARRTGVAEARSADGAGRPRRASTSSSRSAVEISSRARARCARNSASTCRSTPSCRRSPAARRRASRSPRCCSRASTCCASTSRRTTSTSTASSGSSGSSSASPGRSSSCRTTARSSTER